MKKPKKRKEEECACLYGEGCGCQVLHYNEGSQEMDTYHEADKKENYVRKEEVIRILEGLKKEMYPGYKRDIPAFKTCRDVINQAIQDLKEKKG
jgi:hypothetical protein